MAAINQTARNYRQPLKGRPPLQRIAEPRQPDEPLRLLRLSRTPEQPQPTTSARSARFSEPLELPRPLRTSEQSKPTTATRPAQPTEPKQPPQPARTPELPKPAQAAASQSAELKPTSAKSASFPQIRFSPCLRAFLRALRVKIRNPSLWISSPKLGSFLHFSPRPPPRPLNFLHPTQLAVTF